MSDWLDETSRFIKPQPVVQESHRSKAKDGGVKLLVIESCHSTWVFDAERGLFRRVLKAAGRGDIAASTLWQPYYGLEMDDHSDGFVVVLNADGSRLLRSWRHLSGSCASCGAHETMELSLEDLQRAGRA